MFRDKNHLMRLIKTRLGIYTIKLPMTDKDLFETVIIDTTLPQFSIFLPFKHKIVIDTTISAVDPEEDVMAFSGDNSPANNLIRIPNILGSRAIIGVNRVDPYNNLAGLTMTSSYESLDSYEDLVLAQGMANLASAMMPPKTFEFISPDKIMLYNNHGFSSKIIVEVLYEHHPELHTITQASRDSFFKLALLDMKIFLFNNLKHYADIETAYGHLNLKIDEWSGAEQDREALIDKWTDTYHLDQNSLFFI